MTLEMVLRLLGGVVLIAANAFFVAVEFALTRLRGLELTESEIDEQGLRVAWDLTDRLEIHLTACQLGISSSSVLLGVVAEPALTKAIEPLVGLVGVEGGSVRGISLVVALVILNLVHKIWGEQAPTYLGVERPRDVARVLAPGLALWSKFMSPVVNLGDGLAKGSLRMFGVEITRSWTDAEAGAQDADSAEARLSLVERVSGMVEEEGLARDRREEILQAIRIDEIPVQDVMVSCDEVVWLHLDDDPEDVFAAVASAGFTRYPVAVSGDADCSDRKSVAGVCYAMSLFRLSAWREEGAVDLAPLLAPACFLPSDISIADMVDRLQSREQEVALLTDPADEDRLVGLITVSDAFEVIAGELHDPLDSRV